MLHYDFIAFSFSELLDWIKSCLKITWKTQRTKEIDWGPSPSIPDVNPLGFVPDLSMRGVE
jgi:hypothetical protein